MSDITRLVYLYQGLPQDIDATTNSLQINSLKVGSSTPVELTKVMAQLMADINTGSAGGKGLPSANLATSAVTTAKIDSTALDYSLSKVSKAMFFAVGPAASQPVSLEVYNDVLYGLFGSTVKYFDGSTWVTMAGVPGTPSIIKAGGGYLYACGTAGTWGRWDGTSWTTITGSPNPLTYIGNGGITFVGSNAFCAVPGTGLRKLTDTTWSTVSSTAGLWTGLMLLSITAVGNIVYVFPQTGNPISIIDTVADTHTTMASAGTVQMSCEHNGQLWATGGYGGSPATFGLLGYYNGSAWVGVSTTHTGRPSELFSLGGNLYTGSDGNVSFGVWNGTAWSAISGIVQSSMGGALIAGSTNLGVYFGGNFTSPTTYVAKYDAPALRIQVADSQITTIKLADSGVTTAKILDSNVTTAKIADNNITTIKIADSNVTNAKIADSAVTAVKTDAIDTYPAYGATTYGTKRITQPGSDNSSSLVENTTTGRMFIVTWSGGVQGQYSDDRGKTWTNLASPLLGCSGFFCDGLNLYAASGTTFYKYSNAQGTGGSVLVTTALSGLGTFEGLHVSGSNVWVYGSSALLYSSDGGTTFTNISTLGTGTHPSSSWFISVLPSGSTLFIGSYWGLFKCTTLDGTGVWSEVEPSANGTYAKRLTIYNGRFYYGRNSDIRINSAADCSGTWTTISSVGSGKFSVLGTKLYLINGGVTGQMDQANLDGTSRAFAFSSAPTGFGVGMLALSDGLYFSIGSDAFYFYGLQGNKLVKTNSLGYVDSTLIADGSISGAKLAASAKQSTLESKLAAQRVGVLNFTPSLASSDTVTTQVLAAASVDTPIGAGSGIGSAAARGIFVGTVSGATDIGKVLIRVNGTDNGIDDGTGDEIYAVLSEAAGVYTLSYKKADGSAYTMLANDVSRKLDFYFIEIMDLWTFGVDRFLMPAIGGVVDATTSNSLNTKILTETSNLQASLAAEATARAAADGILSADILAEASARSAADGILSADILAEASARSAADGILDAAILAESTARSSADGILSASITAEASARTLADIVLQGELDTTQGSMGNVIDGDGAWLGFGATKPAGTTNYLNSALTVTAALKALDTEEFVLQTSITAEASARNTADLALQAQLSNISSDKTFLNLTSSGAVAIGDVLALSKDVAGRVILANASDILTCTHIVGVATEAAAGAGELIKIQVTGEIVVNKDAAFTLGERVYVHTVSGQASKTPPSTIDDVVYLLGGATDTDKLYLAPHLEFVVS